MFEQTFVETGRRKPWTFAISLSMECLLVVVLVLIPLMHIEALPRALRWTGLEPPPGQSSEQQPAPMQRQRIERTQAFSEFQADRLQSPARIPDRIAEVHDPPGALELAQAGPPGLGVPGGTGPNNALMRMLEPARPSVPTPAAAARPPEIKQRVVVGGVVQQAMAVSQPQPVYPDLARRTRISGIVRLTAVISENGTIEELRVIEGHSMLVPAALDAVKRWRYRPTILNGVPVKVETNVEVHFTLN